MTNISIRKYSEKHRQSVREICFNTGLGGDSISPYFDDLDLFADMIILYYTDYEPQSALVAVHNGQAVGYLLGCADTNTYIKVMRREIAPQILTNIVRGKYNIRRKTRDFLRRYLRDEIPAIFSLPSLDLYPAHLHINLEEGYRRSGAGARLMKSFFKYLLENGIGGVYLGTSSLNTQALPFYKKLGFTMYRRSRTDFWRGLLDRDVYNIIFVKRLCPQT